MLEYYWIINIMYIKLKWYYLIVKNKRKLGNILLIFRYFILYLWYILYIVIIILNIIFFLEKKFNFYIFVFREVDVIFYSVCEISDSYILRFGYFGRFNVYFYL